MDSVRTLGMSEPGWYPDTRDAAVTHYWSGTAWTERRVWTGTQWIDPAAPRPETAVVHGAIPASAPIGRKLANRAYVTVGGASVAAIGCALPWASVDYGLGSQSINGTQAGGGQIDLVLALVIAGLGVLFLTGRTGFKTNVLSLVLAALVVVICVANMVDIVNLIDKEQAAAGDALTDTGTSTQLGSGIVIVLVSGLTAVVGLLSTLVRTRRVRTASHAPRS
jgi:Na+/H+ antiporter NhaC